MIRGLLPTMVCITLMGWVFFAAAPPSAPSHRYADAPPLAHTGGFGEPTCAACHFGQPLNADGGSLTITGVPDRFEAGTPYRVTVTLYRPDLGRGGFELAVRFPDSTQAGTLRPVTDRSRVSSNGTSRVQYAHHTAAGTSPSAPDSSRWVLEWIAPPHADSVTFHVSANAANFDASEFGDFVYVTQQVSNASDGRE